MVMAMCWRNAGCRYGRANAAPQRPLRGVFLSLAPSVPLSAGKSRKIHVAPRGFGVIDCPPRESDDQKLGTHAVSVPIRSR